MSAEPAHQQDLVRTVIEPPKGWLHLGLSDVWRYRDLLILLTWRDISARYRQSLIGYGWAILRPMLSAAIFTLVFSVIARIETDVPYPLFAFAGLMPWMYFSNALTGVTASIVSSGSLLTKVYFPRLILPLAKVAVGLVELGLQFFVLIALMAWFGYMPGLNVVFVPLFVLITVATSLAFGIWLAAFNVKFRDVGMAVPFLLQSWMYLCPIVYPIGLVPPAYRTLYGLNPMVGVVEGFRWSILGTSQPAWEMIGVSLLTTCVVLIGGLAYFRRVETTFADVI